MTDTHTRCFTTSGFGVWTACIERASNLCYVTSGNVTGDCFKEDPCERAKSYFRDVDDGRALLEKDLIVIAGKNCLYAHAGSTFCKEQIKAFHVRVVIKEGNHISKGQTIAFTLSKKSTVRRIRAKVSGLVLLVHWNPQASIDEYTIYVDCMGQVRLYERGEERRARDI